MRMLKFVLPALVLASGLVVTTQRSDAKAEYSKKEKKGCVHCHTKMGSKDLNAVGKCYGEKKSLDGCAAEKK